MLNPRTARLSLHLHKAMLQVEIYGKWVCLSTDQLYPILAQVVLEGGKEHGAISFAGFLISDCVVLEIAEFAGGVDVGIVGSSQQFSSFLDDHGFWSHIKDIFCDLGAGNLRQLLSDQIFEAVEDQQLIIVALVADYLKLNFFLLSHWLFIYFNDWLPLWRPTKAVNKLFWNYWRRIIFWTGKHH